MLTIEYIEEGKRYSDFEAEQVANEFCDEYKKAGKDLTYQVSTDNMIYVMRLMVVEGKISYTELQFKFNNNILTVNAIGEIQNYTEGFCSFTTDILFKLLKAKKITTGSNLMKNITVNSVPMEVNNVELSYEQVLELDGLKNTGVYSMVYTRGRNGSKGSLVQGDSIIVSDGMRFSVGRTDNA